MPSRTNPKKRSTILISEGGTFRLPGGFRVTVRLLDKEEAKDEMGGQVLAQYLQAEHEILLKRSRTKRQRRADLEHELNHMAIDWCDHFVRRAT